MIGLCHRCHASGQYVELSKVNGFPLCKVCKGREERGSALVQK